MRWALALIGLAALLAGCGFDVQSPDLFLLTRTGEGGKLTLLVNDGGNIRCNGRKRSLPDSLLLEARDLANLLDGDAKAGLRIASPPNSVFRYTISHASRSVGVSTAQRRKLMIRPSETKKARMISIQSRQK